MAKAIGGLAGNACKARFDNRDIRTNKPFLSLRKGLRSNQFLFLLKYLSSFKKHFTKKVFHRLDLAKIKNKIYSAFNSSFRLIMPILLIEKQNNSQLVIHLGSREKCGKAN